MLGATPQQNLDMIADSVGFVAEHGREAVYDAEHFFDGYRGDRDYALSTLRAARQAGARTLVLCDTNGGTLTDDLVRILADVRGSLEADPDAPAVTWGIHTHNDAELAVANSIAAVQAGVRHVQATINGYGERCGNANMVSILANLALKTELGLTPPGGGDLPALTELSRSRRGDREPDPERLPAVRRPVGVRAQGRRPRRRGRQGRAELPARRPDRRRQRGPARGLGAGRQGEHRDPRPRSWATSWRVSSTRKVLSQLIKRLEHEGLAFEGAEASFELLIRRNSPGYEAPFRIVDYTCLVEQRAGRELLAEATVKVEVAGEVLHTAADGNGPVNALDGALRKALRAFYPQLDTVHLVDYKVRILDGATATAARTRVIIDSQDGSQTWSTMGSDTNIIAASAQALADSLEFAIWKANAEVERRDERHFTTAPWPTPRGRAHDRCPPRALDGHVRLQHQQPCRRRHPRRQPRLEGVGGGQRTGRRAVPGGRPGAGRPARRRPPAAARLRRPRARRGARRRRGG